MKELENLIEEYKRIILSEERLKQITKELKTEKLRNQELASNVENEYYDIVELESLPIQRLFGQILKNRIVQLEKEKQEYLQAVLLFKESNKVISILQFEQKILLDRITRKNEIHSQLIQAIKKQHEQTAKNYHNLKDQLIEIGLLIKKVIEFKTEVNEAIVITEKLLDLLKEVGGLLYNAKDFESWGEFYHEIQQGKKMQQSYIDQAQGLMPTIRKYILIFSKEIADVDAYRLDKEFNNISIPELHYFNDRYYHQLIADWITNKSLLYSISLTDDSMISVSKIRIKLKAMRRSCNVEYQLFKKKEQTIIMKNT